MTFIDIGHIWYEMSFSRKPLTVQDKWRKHRLARDSEADSWPQRDHELRWFNWDELTPTQRQQLKTQLNRIIIFQYCIRAPFQVLESVGLGLALPQEWPGFWFRVILERLVPLYCRPSPGGGKQHLVLLSSSLWHSFISARCTASSMLLTLAPDAPFSPWRGREHW